MLVNFTLSLVASVGLIQDPATTLVWGQVRSTRTGTPLSYALIEVISAGRSDIQVQTDSLGFYNLPNIAPGRRLVRARHVDHAPHEIELIIASGQSTYVGFELELRPVKLPPVHARANALPSGRRDTVRTTAPDIGAATVRALEATPGVAELGLAETAHELPGQDPLDPSDVLFVRGAAADLKLVLLNGAPVNAPFHIGGLISALEPELLRSATLYFGGAPARYDGGLSYVMDLETRSGREQQPHADVSFDMLATRAIIEGPVGPSVSYIIGGRAVHGIGATPFVSDPFPYTYGDALSRVDIEFSNGGTLSLTGFYNRENVLLDSIGSAGEGAEWGNVAGSIRYRGELLGAEALYTLAAGRFESQLPVAGSQPILTKGASQRVRATADFTRLIRSGRIDYGASFDRQSFEQAAVSLLDSMRVLALEGIGHGDVAGLYADGTISASSRLRLRAGARADVFSLGSRAHFSPRAAATYLVSERAALTLSAGRYRQYVRVPEAAVLFAATAAGDSDSQPITVARAAHVALALDQDLGEAVRLGIEGFYKTYDDLPSVSGESAEATGVDLWLRRSTGTVTGWFGYSLAWVWSARDPDDLTPQDFAGRHLVSVGLAGPMPGGGGFDVSVAYGAGLPFTAIPEPEATTPVFNANAVALSSRKTASQAAEPVPPVPTAPNERYLRLDAKVARTFRGDWRGTEFELTPYLKILNALDRRDALFYHFDRAESNPQPRALAGIPILPIVGLQWKF